MATAAIVEELRPPFKRGKGGPGGWMILMEPELPLDRDVIVPDVAGWRRERMPVVPIDRTRKRATYARERVGHVWLVDVEAQALEVFRLDGESYRLVLAAGGDDKVRAEPFDAIELDLSIWWAR